MGAIGSMLKGKTEAPNEVAAVEQDLKLGRGRARGVDFTEASQNAGIPYRQDWAQQVKAAPQQGMAPTTPQV